MFTRQNLTVWFGDSPLAYQIGFQDPATTTMEGIYIFNIDLLCIISMIVIVVAWFLSLILNLFLDSSNSGLKDFTHSDSLEIVWTSIPAFVLLSLASPSFALLCSLDEISNPKLTFKILGHQWYWSYETSDFYAFAGCTKLSYSSCILTNETIQENNYSGYFRNLETNKRVLIPINVHLIFLISSLAIFFLMALTFIIGDIFLSEPTIWYADSGSRWGGAFKPMDATKFSDSELMVISASIGCVLAVLQPILMLLGEVAINSGSGGEAFTPDPSLSVKGACAQASALGGWGQVDGSYQITYSSNHDLIVSQNGLNATRVEVKVENSQIVEVLVHVKDQLAPVPHGVYMALFLSYMLELPTNVREAWASSHLRRSIANIRTSCGSHNINDLISKYGHHFIHGYIGGNRETVGGFVFDTPRQLFCCWLGDKPGSIKYLAHCSEASEENPVVFHAYRFVGLCYLTDLDNPMKDYLKPPGFRTTANYGDFSRRLLTPALWNEKFYAGRSVDPTSRNFRF